MAFDTRQSECESFKTPDKSMISAQQIHMFFPNNMGTPQNNHNSNNSNNINIIAAATDENQGIVERQFKTFTSPSTFADQVADTPTHRNNSNIHPLRRSNTPKGISSGKKLNLVDVDSYVGKINKL